MTSKDLSALTVCPTYVGMNRGYGRSCRRRRSMPHVCGDEPVIDGLGLGGKVVCPTYVGMNRILTFFVAKIQRMPHVCGDEPMLCAGSGRRPTYAPRMWG